MSSRQRDLDQNTLTDNNFKLKTFSRYSKVKLKKQSSALASNERQHGRVENAGNMASAGNR
jgi:hypothetical protein